MRVSSLHCKLQPGRPLVCVVHCLVCRSEKTLSATLLNGWKLRIYVSHLSKQNVDSSLHLVLNPTFFSFKFLIFNGFLWKHYFNSGMLFHYLKSYAGNPFTLESLRPPSFFSSQSVFRSGILGWRAWTFEGFLYIFAKFSPERRCQASLPTARNTVASLFMPGDTDTVVICVVKIFSPPGSTLFRFSLHGVFSCSEVLKIIRSNVPVIFL